MIHAFRSVTICVILLFALVSFFFTTPAAAKKPQPPARWMKMDVGPFFSSTIGPPKDKKGLKFKEVPKAIAIHLGERGEAAMMFDTDLLRMAAGWTGGFVHINPGRDALLGNDTVEGQVQFTTPTAPGWANDGQWKDPRPRPFGPLPSDWAKYRGLYVHGDRVVLSYTVGGVGVLESPWVEHGDGGLTVFSRTFEIEPTSQPMTLIVSDSDGGKAATLNAEGLHMAVIDRGETVTAIGLVGGPTRAKFEVGDRAPVRLVIDPDDSKQEPTKLKLLVWTGKQDAMPAFRKHLKSSNAPRSLEPLTRGGPARWPEPLTTQGRIGEGEGAYVVDTITAPYDNPYQSILHFGGFDFLPGGGDSQTAAICTMEGDVWLVSGIDDTLKKITWKRFASGLYHALGLKVVDGKIYVLGRDQITRLHDLNGDGEADFYENFNNDCQVGHNGHEFATCLETDPQGNFFYMKGTNNSQTAHDGSVIRVSKDGSKLDVYATGFRWPNGMGMSPDGVLTAADQQGNWVPSSRLDIIKPGGFYGYMSSHHRETKPTIYDGPLCWIPHGVDNSSGGQVWVDSKKWGPLDGQMLHLSYGRCLLFLVLQEEIDGVHQGGVVRFPTPKFITGAMRGRFSNADGQLYVCGLKGWQTSGARDGGFQRVRHTGKNVYLPTGLNILKDGIRITFSQPLDKELAGDVESWSIEQWGYRWAKAYGSKEYSVANPDKVGHDPVSVSGVEVSKDGRSVKLLVPDIAPVMQMQIRYNLEAADGEVVRGEIFNTIHKLGER